MACLTSGHEVLCNFDYCCMHLNALLSFSVCMCYFVFFAFALLYFLSFCLFAILSNAVPSWHLSSSHILTITITYHHNVAQFLSCVLCILICFFLLFWFVFLNFLQSHSVFLAFVQRWQWLMRAQLFVMCAMHSCTLLFLFFLCFRLPYILVHLAFGICPAVTMTKAGSGVWLKSSRKERKPIRRGGRWWR